MSQCCLSRETWISSNLPPSSASASLFSKTNDRFETALGIFLSLFPSLKHLRELRIVVSEETRGFSCNVQPRSDRTSWSARPFSVFNWRAGYHMWESDALHMSSSDLSFWFSDLCVSACIIVAADNCTLASKSIVADSTCKGEQRTNKAFPRSRDDRQMCGMCTWTVYAEKCSRAAHEPI
jgi:hypothetical protein